MSQSRMPIGSEVLFPTYYAASHRELGGIDTIDSMFCTEGVGTTDGPWYVMLLKEDYGTLPVLPFPTALPVLNQPTTDAIWVSVNWLVGSGLLPPLEHSYFVAPNGPGLPVSDGSIARPFKTIQEGVDTVPSGSALIIAANTYAEAVVIPDSKDLELFGFGGPVKIQPLTELPAVRHVATGASLGSRIGLYHLQLVTAGNDSPSIDPTLDINFSALNVPVPGNAIGVLILNDVTLTRISTDLTALAQRVVKANLLTETEVICNPSGFNAGSVFTNCGAGAFVNCSLGPVTEQYNPTLPEPLSSRQVHKYISTQIARQAASLTLVDAPNVDFDQDCVLAGDIIATALLGFALPMMPVILFHGTARAGTFALPDMAVPGKDTVLDLDRSQWTKGGCTINKPVVVVSAANTAVSARQMNFNNPGLANHLAINSNLSVDARGLTGFIELVLPGTATTCDRDKASAGSFGAPPPAGLPATTPAVYLDDFLGNPLPFPLGATKIQVLGEVLTSVAPGGPPLLAAPYAIGSKTNVGFDFGFNAADSPAITGSDWLGIRYGA